MRSPWEQQDKGRRHDSRALKLVTFPRVSHVRGNARWSFPAVNKDTQHRHIDTPGCICAVDLMHLAFPIAGKILTSNKHKD